VKVANTRVQRRPITLVEPHRDPTILVVDDDLDARTIFGLYLEAMGCLVYTAADGAAAIREATAHVPDVIVLDLAMPKLDGWAAAERLKRRARTRHIPIIALSAVPGARDSAKISGCDAYLAKPCLPQILWDEISALLGRRSRPGLAVRGFE
jgi:two-component system, cell cycle response regulator DivK